MIFHPLFNSALPEDADNAIQALNGTDLKGRKLKLESAVKKLRGKNAPKEADKNQSNDETDKNGDNKDDDSKKTTSDDPKKKKEKKPKVIKSDNGEY